MSGLYGPRGYYYPDMAVKSAQNGPSRVSLVGVPRQGSIEGGLDGGI